MLVNLAVTKLFLVGFGLLLLTKLFLAAVLDLYSDEVFYWQASTQPALAYSDLPFMTALLIGLGSSLSPGSTFAVRSLFILLGSCLPFLVYWIAKPITGNRHALESAGSSGPGVVHQLQKYLSRLVGKADPGQRFSQQSRTSRGHQLGVCLRSERSWRQPTF